MPASYNINPFRAELLQPADKGVVHEYDLRENMGNADNLSANLNIKDRTGRYNGYTGQTSTWRTGLAGPGYEFNGGNDVIVILPSSWVVTGTEMSVEALFQLGAAGMGSIRSIVDKDGFNGAYSLRAWSDNTLALQTGGGGASNLFSASALSADTLYHAIGVVNTNNNPTRSLYINGALSNSANPAVALSESGTLCLGREVAGNYNFIGIIYFARVYSRALSAMEVQQRYSLLAGRRQPLVAQRLRLGKAGAAGGSGARASVVIAG